MDLRTGRSYASRDAALKAGVPASDIAEIVRRDADEPEVRFATGPFKGRVYKRCPHTRQLVRVR
jgi:hypothetical protein